MYDTIIIGGGPASYSAALYAGRFGLKTLIICGNFDGASNLAIDVENYPGIEKIDGAALIATMLKQAEASGAEKLEGKVVSIARSGEHCFFVKTESGQLISSQTIILCTGTRHRSLGLEHEFELVGRGVSYCATCDGPLYKNRRVAVVGGGDAAVTSVLLLAKHVTHITMIVRESELKAEPVNRQRLMALPKDQLDILYAQEVTSLTIEGGALSGVTLKRPTAHGEQLDVTGLFIEIGSMPNAELAHDVGVRLDEKGAIDVDKSMRTNIDGIFAAGDVTNGSSGFMQYIIAAAEGARAAASAYEDIRTHGGMCQLHAIPFAPSGKE